MDSIKLAYYPYRLNFKYPFRIAHTERTGTDNVYILLSQGEHKAWGESVFVPYYSETLATFQQITQGLLLPNNMDDIATFITGLKFRFPESYFCIGGLDIALHNLRTSVTGQTIAQQYGLSGEVKETSYTLGIASDEEMEQKFNDRPDMHYYKLKVNQEEIGRIVNTFQRLTSKPFTIDANQGFTERKLALEWSYKLADLGVEYLEQPFHKDDVESHLWLKKQSPIPIIADESFQNYADLEKVVKYFDGINLKVMKCGGISEGVAALQRAKEMELKSIIGCMSESSVVSNAAKQISSLADWVDLDGPLLLTNDLFAEERSMEELMERLK